MSGPTPPAAFPAWSVVPFAALLLSIAILPLVAERWWHRNRNKALVGIVFGFPIAAWTAFLDPAALGHTGLEYLAFLSLLGSLFIVAGGIEVRGNLPGTPLVNTALLGFGAVLANLVGTTGASLLLIRPWLRANRKRQRRTHLIVFFIFVVSNVGGLLTPLGDPPLFLGFLHGVPFTWTLSLWGPWAFVVSACLLVFAVLDTTFYGREKVASHVASAAEEQAPMGLSLHGKRNVVLLLSIMASVDAGGAWIAPWATARWGEHGSDVATKIFQIVVLSGLAAASLAATPPAIRKANEFSWHPFVEVAVLFAGIFAAMIPALKLLSANGSSLNVTQPWQYFWATGSLSAFLDNAPTYLALYSMAQYLTDEVAGPTARVHAAISCGAVFFGAMTYIGNGPNFMVKAIAEHSGVKTPSFFRYFGWSLAVLGPIFVAVTLIFFR
ncbi:MAG: sodium:proton antiporter [Planctomycetia bacterium]|nr:sodium:proton antiporter [Planctomycetia bacterium]